MERQDKAKGKGPIECRMKRKLTSKREKKRKTDKRRGA